MRTQSMRYLKLIFCLLGFTAVAVWANPPEGNWTEDLQAGLSRAAKEKKPALLMFSASWCGPCNNMKKTVFTQEKVKKNLESLVAVYVDGDEHRDLMEKYQVEAFPTFVVLSPAGKEVGRFVGGVDADTFLKRIKTLQTELPRLESLIQKNPKDPAPWKQRGNLLEEMGNVEEAVKAYQQAKALDPQNKTGAATDVAFFDAAKMGEDGTKGADARFAAFLQSYPDSPRAEDAMLMRARLALMDHRNDDAAKILAAYQQKYPKGRLAEDARQMREYLQRPSAPPVK